jgi:hypothetical protein
MHGLSNQRHMFSSAARSSSVCLNGWTCGNIVTTPRGIARFHYDLHLGRIVKKASLAQMLDFVSENAGWAPMKYGLGSMPTWPFRDLSWLPDPEGTVRVLGGKLHLGMPLVSHGWSHFPTGSHYISRPNALKE